MDIQNVDINNVRGYYRNAKKHDTKQIKNVAESIRQFGFVQPIVIDKDGVIIIGHCRYEAAKRLRMNEVPCVRVEDLSDTEVQKLRLLDNKLNESEWDFDLLAEDIPTLDFSDFDIDWGLPEDIEENTEIEEDEAPEPPTEPKVKIGDLWQLGSHRLICGDSTDTAVIDRLMDRVKAKLLLTDPPYGINADKGVGGFGSSPKTANKYDDEWDSFSPSKDTFDMILEKADNSIIFGGNYFTDKLPLGKCWIVWDKVGDIQFQNPYSDCELAWTNIERNSVKKYTKIQQGFVADEKEKRVHPTQKPVGMLADILKDFSKENDSILDVFGGSGSTLIACEQLNRKCYMAELDPHYCDVIISRYENFTGETAVRIVEGGD